MIRAIKYETHEELEVSWAALIEGVNTRSTIGRYWIPITLVKWAILSLTLVLIKDYPTFQIIIAGYLLLVSQILIIMGKPFASHIENKLSLFNDIMASLYLYGLYALAEPMGRNESKEECGLALLALVVFTIAVNVIKVLAQATMLINFKKLLSRLSSDRVVQLKPMPAEQPQPDQSIASTSMNLSYDEHPQMKMLRHFQFGEAKTVAARPDYATVHKGNFGRIEAIY
ncbi:hypothetical protein FGO68_gene11351 [Halteria grandinella]|uniref:Uncharacterized protein n=1 Tax=Halteria grandinella TaxID=5974 RepID=A0A8J8P623_HALGN|nr:hypothetical protein FGO68_gene11351 [Halteria grandinella]